MVVAEARGEAAARRGSDPRWAWIAVLFGAWIVVGLFLIVVAVNRGLIRDVGISPYHALIYSGLLVLSVVSIGLVLRARRRSLGWQAAFPSGYGALGAGLVTLLATLVLDVAWREGVGIAAGIENSYAPSRVLLVVGLVLVAMAPLRASLLAGGDRAIRWPASISAGLMAASVLAAGAFNVIGNPWLEKPADLVADNGEVWVMDGDGGRQTRLVEAAEGVELTNPVWTPDAKQIAYVRIRGSGDPLTSDYDIWLVNADGTGRRAVASGRSWQWFPRISPDGTWLEYTDEAVGGPWLSSGPTGPDVGQGPQGAVFPGANAAALPQADLWRVPLDGHGAPERITDAAGDDRSGAWSPDGTRLAFDSTRDGNTELYLVDADGSETVRLTDTPSSEWAASWSPDGSRIAYTSDATGIAQIWTMNADGSNPAQLTFSPDGNLWPAWSPDGSRIAFTAWAPEGTQVWSMAVDGSDPRNLSNSPSSHDSVWDGSWGPDGRIAFTRSGPAPAALQPIAREDLGVATMLASALVLALVVGLLVKTGPPFGGVALATGIAIGLASFQADAWRFLPAAIVAGLIVDVGVRLAPVRWRVVVGTAGAAFGLVVAVAISVAATTGIGWSPTLLIGTAVAAALAGWAIGSLLERHAFGRDEEAGPGSAEGSA
jgi:WD40 repeat protein